MKLELKALASMRMLGPVCFERAVVFQHNDGGLSRERREQVYDI